jgi:hypothetical protein
MAMTLTVAQSLTLQLMTPVLLLGFGVLALRVAPEPGTSARTATWFMAGVTFASDGAVATVHALLAVAAVFAGEGTTFFDVYLRFVPPGNDARSMVVLGFALALAWVVLLGRPAPGRRAIVAGAAALLVAGFVVGLFEPPLGSGGDHFVVMSYFGAATAVLLFAALYRAMVRKSIDWLLWIALALYAVRKAISSNIQIVLAWFGFGGGWAPPIRSIMWAGLVSAVVMLACSVLRLRAKRVVELRIGPPPYHHPGHRLLAWASFLFSPRDVDEVIEPAITDMWVEYSDALIAGHPAHARWVRVRGTYGILATVALLIAARSGRLLVTVWRLISKT